MSRKNLLLMTLAVLWLLLLASLLSSAPSRARRQPDLLEMSVLLRESDTSSNARQGMEQAAADLNVELRFLSPSVPNDGTEQASLLIREVESNASAILLVPADRQALGEAVRTASAQAALVTIETDMREQGARAHIGTDNTAMGQALAEAAINGVPEGGTVLLLRSALGDNAIQERLDGAGAHLREAGRQVCFMTPETPALQEFLARRSVDAILAPDASALESAAEAARFSPEFPLLYGAGSTAAIAAGLEQNRVTAIAAQNDFAAGYLAVETAANLARRQAVPETELLPFFILRQETMYAPENQKLLFPVT